METIPGASVLGNYVRWTYTCRMNSEANRSSQISTETRRLFIALPLSEAMRDAIGVVQAQLKEEQWPVKWVDPALAHITMKFLGDTPAERVPDIENQLAMVASRHEPVELASGACGAFPKAFRPRVFWIGLDGDTDLLVNLAGDVDRSMTALEFTSEERPFQPHITIGRLRRQTVPPTGFEQIARALTVPQVEICFDRIQLMRSVLSNEGPVYTVLNEWQLGSKAPADDAEHIDLVEHG